MASPGQHILFVMYSFLFAYLPGNYAAEEHGSRRVAKKVWSKAEVAAVMRHFKGHISRGKLNAVTANWWKTPCWHKELQNIRDFVRNRGIAAKRQSEKEKI